MNIRGTQENLIPAHPGNHNATRSGIHSTRVIQALASEIEAELVESFEWSPGSPGERIALQEITRLLAIIDAIDRELGEHGFLDKKGKPSYLLEYRLRCSRKLESWLEKCPGAFGRHSLPDSSLNSFTFIQALQRIALGQDGASPHDRLTALRDLKELGKHAFATCEEDLLPNSSEITEAIFASQFDADSYRQVYDMLVAESEDGKPDYAMRAVAVGVVERLSRLYPALAEMIAAGGVDIEALRRDVAALEPMKHRSIYPADVG